MKSLILSIMITTGLIIIGTTISVAVCLIVPLIAQALGY